MRLDTCPHGHVDGVALIWPVEGQRCNRTINFYKYSNVGKFTSVVNRHVVTRQSGSWNDADE